MRPLHFKRILLAGWSVWWTCVLATNLADAGKELGILPASWPFASGNFRFIAQTTARYEVAPAINVVLFAGVLAWQAVATGLFWLATGRLGGVSARPVLYAAFAAGLLLWLTFMVADELCMAYAVEQTHVHLLIAQTVALLTVELLPEKPL